MAERPLLIFPMASVANKENLPPGFNRDMVFKAPNIATQAMRLAPKFARMEQAFNERKASFQSRVTGAVPEKALVFETAIPIDQFIGNVKKVTGLEWLAEWENEIKPDSDFYFEKDGVVSDKMLGGRLFLIMSDQRAMDELKSLWQSYQNGIDLPYGKKKWKTLFASLKDLRPWRISDRFYETGFMEDWNDRLQDKQEINKFEIELWFRNGQNDRTIASETIKQLIREAQGAVIQEVVLPEIAYHAILAETPISLFENLSEHTDVQLIRSESVMFFRPVGQALSIIPRLDQHQFDSAPARSVELPVKNEPLIALLDGLPLENHNLLQNRLIVDDPDDYASKYTPQERVHGTAMASLIIHGELDKQESPIDRPVYVRPIMIPDDRSWHDIKVECVPNDCLPVDLVHRAVRRLFEPSNEEPPVAPSVKVINLSIGDSARPFDQTISPWARLLDWLSYKYKVLFIVSAGNYTDGINLEASASELISLTSEETSKKVIESIYKNSDQRRILTPSETLNGITVGAVHADSSAITQLGQRKDILSMDSMPSPASRVGLGFRRSIKPDIVMEGGRQLYQDDFRRNYHFIINQSVLAPGHKVAHPGNTGTLSSTIYMRGTSNATALATRATSKVFNVLEELKDSDRDGELIKDKLVAVLIKALLIHGASWGTSFETLKEILWSEENKNTMKDGVIPRLLGYGSVDISRVLECNAERVTLLGCNELTKGNAHIYSIPLPPSMSKGKLWKKLTITLAWFTPVSATNQKYRKAHLWFDAPQDTLALDRVEAHNKSVKRGTIQHEILVGDKATPFLDGDKLEIKVNCREEAGGLKEIVPYSLVVSLEVAEGLNVPIYDEVQARIRPTIQIRPTSEN